MIPRSIPRCFAILEWRPPSAIATVALALCGVLTARAQQAQPAPPPVNGPYRIAGAVVNALTGEPVSRAAVAVLTESDHGTIASTLADGEGRFVLANLPAAKYQLLASKRGYRTAYYDEHDGFSSAIVTAADQDTGHLVFKLLPGAVLRGVVTADGGDPVENASVKLFYKPGGNRGAVRVERTENTDDTGAYEFSDLPAGDYYVAVSAEPWYAMHGSSAKGRAPAGDSGASLDVVYPMTFFDSTSEEASASVISLAPGAVEEANISLHAVPGHHIVLPDGANRGFGPGALSQFVFGVEMPVDNIRMEQSPNSSVIGIAGVPPGHYEMEAGAPPRIVQFDAAADLQINPASGTPTVPVTGIVKNAGSATLPNGLMVMLEPAGGEPSRQGNRAFQSKEGFQFGSVPPGRWRLSASDDRGVLPVLSIAAGAQVLPGNLFTVADKPLHLTVTVSRGTMRVDGLARSDGKGFAGAMIVLVPKNLSQLDSLVRRDQSDSDGSFSLRDAAPGEYIVIALRDAWSLDWSRPEFLRRFLPRGVSVTVTETPAKSMSLASSVPVQSP